MISIHALRMESDCKLLNGNRYIVHFYPRSPHGERPPAYDCSKHALNLSIHALRMESDGTLLVLTVGLIRSFYPRSPHGERQFDFPKL